MVVGIDRPLSLVQLEMGVWFGPLGVAGVAYESDQLTALDEIANIESSGICGLRPPPAPVGAAPGTVLMHVPALPLVGMLDDQVITSTRSITHTDHHPVGSGINRGTLRSVQIYSAMNPSIRLTGPVGVDQPGRRGVLRKRQDNVFGSVAGQGSGHRDAHCHDERSKVPDLLGVVTPSSPLRGVSPAKHHGSTSSIMDGRTKRPDRCWTRPPAYARSVAKNREWLPGGRQVSGGGPTRSNPPSGRSGAGPIRFLCGPDP